MRDSLARRDGSALGAWNVENARLDRETFAQGLALLAAGQREALTLEHSAAYFLALADIEPVDFVAGVRLALMQERFMTPAAVREHCEAARERRWSAEQREKQIEESRRWRAEEAAREAKFKAREAELKAQVAGWAAPPTSAEALYARLVALIELRRRPAVTYLVRNAEASGSTRELMLTTEFSSLLASVAEVAELEELASEAAGHPVRVRVRRAASAPAEGSA